MESQNKIILVLAGSQKEFDEYRKRTTEERKNRLKYGYNESSVLGVEISEVVVYGTAHERKNFWNLKRIAEARVR